MVMTCREKAARQDVGKHSIGAVNAAESPIRHAAAARPRAVFRVDDNRFNGRTVGVLARVDDSGTGHESRSSSGTEARLKRRCHARRSRSCGFAACTSDEREERRQRDVDGIRRAHASTEGRSSEKAVDKTRQRWCSVGAFSEDGVVRFWAVRAEPAVRERSNACNLHEFVNRFSIGRIGRESDDKSYGGAVRRVPLCASSYGARSTVTKGTSKDPTSAGVRSDA
jgi:hypothetical protein